MKTTTKDCVDLIVQHVREGRISADWAWNGESTVTKEFIESVLTDPKCWSRIYKQKAGNGLWTYTVTDLDGVTSKQPATNFKYERHLNCDKMRPDGRGGVFDGQVAYLVLERANGTIVLGDYVGD